jgi:hypothetical protein
MGGGKRMEGRLADSVPSRSTPSPVFVQSGDIDAAASEMFEV